jgi:hypothetical protein
MSLNWIALKITNQEDDMTLPPLDLLELNMSGLSINDMVVRLGTVAELVAAHAGYQDKLPDEVPGPPQLRLHAEELHQADLEAANKDRLKMAKRGEKYQESAVALALFGQFAVMRAIKNNDMKYIDDIGYDRKKKSTGNNKAHHSSMIGAPQKFNTKYGPDSGSLLFQVGKVTGAAHYDIYGCLGDPNNEASWELYSTFVNTRNIRIDGLEPGKVYYFRVRCLGPNGFGPWSKVIKIMVV